MGSTDSIDCAKNLKIYLQIASDRVTVLHLQEITQCFFNFYCNLRLSFQNGERTFICVWAEG